MIYQRTIKTPVTAIGVGLHSGCRVKLVLKPAKSDQGIVFVRTDLSGSPRIKCHPFLINDTRLSSTLVENNGIRVATVEHLMSAFACMGIDNIVVELSAPEVPIMDGSSNSFLYLLNLAEVVEQDVRKKYIKIKHVVEVIEDDKWVRLKPHDGYKIKLTIGYDHALFKLDNTVYEVDFAKQSYINEISRARTFAFMSEVETIRRSGLGLGGNLSNALVIGEYEVLNSGGLRFKDEFVRHKILDAIGDLHIMGNQIIGAFEGYKSGHAINNKLLRKLVNFPDTWEYVDFDDEDHVPNSFHYV